LENAVVEVKFCKKLVLDHLVCHNWLGILKLWSNTFVSHDLGENFTSANDYVMTKIKVNMSV